MCDILPGGRRVRHRMPRHPQCLETNPPPENSPTTRGTTGASSNLRQRYQQRFELSLQRAGINEAIERLHATLLSEARRMSASMSYESFTTLDANPNQAIRLFQSVLQNVLENIRDAGLSRMLPQFVMRLMGSPLTYLTGLQSVYDQSRWDSRDAGRRNSFRTQQVYAHLIWVYASSASDNNLQRAIEYNQTLVTQGLRYIRWKEQELPRLRAWVLQNTTVIDRGGTWDVPSTGLRHY